MLRNNYLTLIMLLMANFLVAQVTISGTVHFANEGDNLPVPGWNVQFFMGAEIPAAEAITDENGFYEIEMDITLSGETTYYVSAIDICTGDFLTVDLDVSVDITEYDANFTLCDGINPPDPTEGCDAFFFSEQNGDEDEGYVVQFFDLSFHSEGIDTWEWSFGDGHNSTESNPTHHYENVGEYLVTLTISGEIEGELCTSTMEAIIIVHDQEDCDCPTDEYDPVCVFSPSGEIFEFTNPCYAACAGYDESHFQSCENDCNCPDFYAPVCVLSAEGFFLPFDNHCFAECAGYGPDQWLDCEPNECECPNEYNPVCVYTPSGGTEIIFDNACLAECAGFSPGEYQECGSECICPEFYQPVCVTTPDGVVLTFDNFCFAQCEGYGPDQWTECEPNECECTDEYDPVCVATPSGQILTFTNACEAECAGFSEDIFYSCDGEVCSCPEYEDPVCVTTSNGETLVFSNPCFAECEGYTADDYFDCDPWGCGCPSIYDPVCVNGFAGQITFNNACEAECAGFTEADFVECEEECNCFDLWDPVCVSITGNPFDVITFPNACVAECEGFSPEDFVNCEWDCACDDVWDPVCVLTEDGAITTFSNECEAACFGYTPDQFVDCEEECICPAVWDPVCVATDTGFVVMYSNACEAECEGYTADDYFDCNNTGCDCPEIWDPVCVNGFAGVITFPNECVALCEGFSPDMFVECDTECECDDFFLPVCVANPITGEFLEFINPCYAACEGYSAEDIVECFPSDDCWSEFGFDIISEDGLTVQFNDFSYASDEITSWSWDFGDGNTSTEQNPMHTYAEGGVYDITLVITSELCGEISSLSHICLGDGGGVGGPECQSFFFFEQPDSDNLLSFQFIDLSFGEVNAWVWDFGDGNTSTEQNPSHTYDEAGDYIVNLTIFAEECQSTVTMPVTAGENIWYGELECRAWFLPINSPDNNEVFFINLSSPDAIEFTWDFGDGEISNDPLALHEYAEAGVYTITLTIVTANGCTNSFSTTIDLSSDGFASNPSFFLVSSTDEIAKLTGLEAAPNPSNGTVRINWNVEKTGQYTWQLFDINGRMVKQGQDQSLLGTANLNLDLTDQAAGVYLFRLKTIDGIQTLRLSKF